MGFWVDRLQSQVRHQPAHIKSDAYTYEIDNYLLYKSTFMTMIDGNIDGIITVG